MGTIAKQLPGTMTTQGFLSFLETRPEEERWQLLDGRAVMMNPPTLVHQVIAMNLAWRLNDALAAHRPELLALVEVGLTVAARPAFLPRADLLVLHTPVDYVSYANRIYLTAEILSDSNTQEYMTLKQERYAEHPDNLYSLVIAQRELRVEVRSRASGWKAEVLRSPEDILDLPEFRFTCELRHLYRGTPLE